MSARSIWWRTVYVLYPPLLRVLERIRIHSGRQDFLFGRFTPGYTPAQLEKFLTDEGFEPSILAWRDRGEVLSMRKVDRDLFQYHIRLFSDGELRGHYEYSSEGNPWAHVTEKCFEPRREYFERLLGPFLTSDSK